MIDEMKICSELSITLEQLQIWVEQGWLAPTTVNDGVAFTPADVARAQLIVSLSRDFGANEEGIDLILYLLDQVHDLRRMLRAVRATADRMQPEARQVLWTSLLEELASGG